jgi:ADP-ribose pyrophosphatase YjhB (NUDIX family)
MSPDTRFYYSDPEAPEPNRPRTLSVNALIERDGALLLERRVDAPMWSLIGGRVEDGETLADALAREVHEETGLVVDSYELFGTFSDPTRLVSYPDGNVFRVTSLVYLVGVESFDGLRAGGESHELRFFPGSELLELDVPELHRPVLECYVADGPRPHLQ